MDTMKGDMTGKIFEKTGKIADVKRKEIEAIGGYKNLLLSYQIPKSIFAAGVDKITKDFRLPKEMTDTTVIFKINACGSSGC